VDLTPKKAAIKLMIQKELEKLAEEADESEEDEEDAGKSEGRTTGQKA
jgi:protein DEK